jgi:RNA polymerase sigma-70 factor, ECF subfamily
MSSRATEETGEHTLDPDALGDHLDRLFRAALSMCRSREDAEDLVQETYVRVLARKRLLRSDNDLAYLLRVLRNTFISRHRAAERRPVAAEADPETLDLPDVEGADPLVTAQTREILAAIRALPPEFRDAVVAIDVAGLSYGQAAKTLQVRRGTIASRLFRARDQVAESLTGGSKDRLPKAEALGWKECVPA